MRGGTFLALLLVLLGATLISVGAKRRGKQFLAELKK